MAGRIPEPLADVLDAQCGIVTRAQALGTGLTTADVRYRLGSGRWQQLQRGVYAAFSGPVGRDQVFWAAVLRAGEGALLSHHTAAELDGLADRAMSPIHLVVPAGRRVAGVTGAVVHLSTQAAPRAHPARMPPRTRIEETVLDLTDLCATVDDACGWVTRAVGRRLSTVQRLQASIAVRCRLRWRGELTRLLSADGIHPSLEYRYYRDVECRHRLPRARRQAWASLAGRSCYHDVLYDKQRVAVELDGRDAHPAERRWADIRRDNAAAAAGFVTLRYGWLDVSQRPCECAAEIARVLIARGGATSRPCGPSCPVPAAG